MLELHLLMVRDVWNMAATYGSLSSDKSYVTLTVALSVALHN